MNINKLKFKKYPVLDQGFICLVDAMGDDAAICQAARVSYDKDILKCKTCNGYGYVPDTTTPFPSPDELAAAGITHCPACTETSAKDRNLIRYLMSHQHTTPFEMVEIKFMVQVPMDCWRQWIRHRTACLSADTELVFNRPVDGKAYRMTVGEVFNKFQPSFNARPDRQTNKYFKRDRVQQMQLRSLNEDTGEPITTSIVDIWETGTKDIFKLTLTNGRSIRASKDHRVYTESGWKLLKDIVVGENVITVSSRFGEVIKPVLNVIDPDTEYWVPLLNYEEYYEISSQGRVRRIVGGKGSRSFGRCKKITVSNSRAVVSLNTQGSHQATIQIHRAMMLSFFGKSEDASLTEVCHEDGNPLNNTIDNLRWGTSKDNSEDMISHGTSTYLTSQPVMVVSIEPDGREMTYDLEVVGPYRNFSANDIIVHNSVNEYSTRYTEAIDACQTTPPDQWRLQATDNKQGSSGFLDKDKWDGTEDGRCLSNLEHKFHKDAIMLYRQRLNAGIAKEQARKDLPLSTYTRAYWKCDLHNIFNFLRLRMDSHAQLEIRSYANAMYEIVKQIVPVACEAFEDYVLNAKKFSAMEMEIIKDLMSNMFFTENALDFSKLTSREITEFKKKVGI